MFSVGDKILYPMHGAGVIQNLEEKQVDGQTSTYYVLDIPIGNLTVTISSKKVNSLGIRYVCTKKECSDIIEGIDKIENNAPDNWNKRYEYNLEKIKSGELYKSLEVYLCLYNRERSKGLSGMEKKLLSTAKQVILSEIIISQGIDKPYAEEILKGIVEKNLDDL